MAPRSSARWLTFTKIGLGLGTAVAVAAVIQNVRRGRQGSRTSAPDCTTLRSEESTKAISRPVTIRRPRDELFQFCRDFANLPGFIDRLEKVEPGQMKDHSFWFITGPTGREFKIEIRIDREIENELIVWKSTEGSEVEAEGCMTFTDAPGERGTRVSLNIAFDESGGVVGQAIAKLMSIAPEIRALHDLKRLKMLLEAGEIATSDRRKAQSVTPIHRSKEIA